MIKAILKLTTPKKSLRLQAFHPHLRLGNLHLEHFERLSHLSSLKRLALVVSVSFISCIPLFLFLLPNANANVVHYGRHPRSVELSALEQSLLIFPSAPVSAVCTPLDSVELVAVQSDPLTPVEEAHLAVGSTHATHTTHAAQERIGERMLRVKPLRQSGEVFCSFYLTNRNTVAVTFILSHNVSGSTLDFRPIASTATSVASGSASLRDRESALSLARAALFGVPVGTLNDTNIYGRSALDATSPRQVQGSFARPLASYTLDFAASNGHFRVFSLQGRVRATEVLFEDLIKVALPLGLALFSVVDPQPKSFKKGDTFRHILVLKDEVSPKEFREALP